MSQSSISNQVNHALSKVTWEKEQIRKYQLKRGVPSVKKSLRPSGDPTRPLPVILGINTRRTYFKSATTFFKRAEKISGHGLLADLLEPDIVRITLQQHYSALAPGTVKKTLAAIEKVYLGCFQLGWTKISCPITPELREWVKSFRDDYGVRASRFGYRPEDAERVIAYLKEKKSTYVHAAELAFHCGLRVDEIAGLKGENIDAENKILNITGKGGRFRQVPIADDLLHQLNQSKQYIFTPSASWRKGFSKAIEEATISLGIEISGVHRLRANYAQNKYLEFMGKGMNDHEARLQVSELLGHGRLDVTFKYVPKGFK